MVSFGKDLSVRVEPIKLKIVWTCSNNCNKQHKWWFTAWVHGSFLLLISLYKFRYVKIDMKIEEKEE